MLHKYETYKEAEVDLMNPIPSHWQVKRLKDISTVISKGTTPTTEGAGFTDFGVRFLKAENINENGSINETPLVFISEETDKLLSRSRLRDSDLLIVIAGATTGKIAILPKELLPANTNQAVCFIRLHKYEQGRFLKYKQYALSSPYFQRLVWLYAVTSAQPNLPMAVLSRMHLHYPPLEEQTAIAKYLDTKTQAIDQRVSLLEKKIGYYQELRKSLINEAVTKGLDKNVKLKDSGIDWIGQIPAHWEVKRLKDCFHLFTGNSISDKSGFENPVDSIPYVATKDIDFYTGKITYDNGIYIPIVDKSFKRAKPNTTLICIEGANAGKKIGFTEQKVAFVNKLCAIKRNNQINYDKYLYYFTQTNLFNSQFFSLLNGLIGGVSVSLIRQLNVLIPSKDEQVEIVEYLDSRLSQIDQIISNIQTQITTLKELRKTLINDVVTGKIKVSHE